MKKKLPQCIKDGIVGIGIGIGVIIPGISAGTIALITGAYKKIIGAIGNLFSKLFFKNLLILVPFLIGAVLAIIALIKPFQLAFDYAMLAIVCLFGGFIIGSLPTVTDEVKGEKPNKINIIVLIIAFIVATLIGVLSVFLDSSATITKLFDKRPIYLYFILIGIGMLSASGIIVPGFSASMLLLVIGFYKPILGLISTKDLGQNILLLCMFAIGVIIGIVLFSKLMNYCLTKHKRSTYFVIIGFILGSLISIFFNSSMFTYFGYYGREETGHYIGIIDAILSPILLIGGVILSYLFVIYIRKHPEIKQEQEK